MEVHLAGPKVATHGRGPTEGARLTGLLTAAHLLDLSITQKSETRISRLGEDRLGGIGMEGLEGKVIVFAGSWRHRDVHSGFPGRERCESRCERCRSKFGSRRGECSEATRACGGLAVVADISDEEQVRHLMDVATETYGRIHGLWNVAAYFHPDEVARDTNVVDIDLGDWQRNIDINLIGYLLTLRDANTRTSSRLGEGRSSTRSLVPGTRWRNPRRGRQPGDVGGRQCHDGDMLRGSTARRVVWLIALPPGLALTEAATGKSAGFCLRYRARDGAGAKVGNAVLRRSDGGLPVFRSIRMGDRPSALAIDGGMLMCALTVRLLVVNARMGYTGVSMPLSGSCAAWR